MKKTLSLALSLFIYFVTYAQDYQWTKTFGNTDTEYSRYMVSDNNGDIYIVGNFKGTIDLDPSSGTDNHTSAGDDDVFVVKLDNAGTFIWGKTYGGTDYDYANSIATDASGNVYICGTFTGTTDLNPSSSAASFTSNGSYDVYILKLNSSGTYQWGKTFGGTASDYVRVIAVDGSSNVYTVGYFDDTVDFDPGSGTDNETSDGGTDIFIEKLNSSGSFEWVKTYGSASSDKAYSIAIDSADDIYITGCFSDTINFNPISIVGAKKGSNGSTDVFVLKLSSAASFKWVKTFGGIEADCGITIDVDASTHVVLSGYFDDTVDFDPSSGVDSQTGKGGDDIFVEKLDISGNYVWAKIIGGTKDEQPATICTDAMHNIYLVGYFKGTADFDPGAGTASYTSNGGSNDDGFFEKLDENGNFKWVGTYGASNSDYVNFVMVDASNDLYISGFFKNTVDFDPSSGTDSYTANGSGYSDVFISKYAMCTDASSTISASSCDDYISPSGNYTWTSSGTYTDTLSTSLGCDSVITVALTITDPTASITETSCGTYLSPSGNYSWTSSGVYTDTLMSVQGCDSIITINLTIEAIDTSVMKVGNSLTAVVSSATYQWIDCDNGYVGISGETNQSFEPSISGNYAVIVSANGCSDTSSCYAVSVTSNILENTFAETIRILPNPSSGELRIETSGLNNLTVKIENSLGQILMQKTFNQTRVVNLYLEQARGIYFITIENEVHQKAIMKVIKE